MATSQGEVHKEFLDLIKEEKEVATSLADAANLGVSPRKWDLPLALTTSPLDPKAVFDAFPRTDINENYAKALASTSPGTVGDTESLKLQCDYVATQHRDFASRHASPCRAFAHAAARRRGHGDANGLFGARLEQEASLPIAYGAQNDG